jgi:hypothetical protein
MSSALLFDVEYLKEDNKKFYWELVEKKIDVFYHSCLREYFRDYTGGLLTVRGLNKDTDERLKDKNNFYSLYCVIYFSEIDKIINNINKSDEDEKEELIEKLIGLKWVVNYIISTKQINKYDLNYEDIRIIFYIGN